MAFPAGHHDAAAQFFHDAVRNGQAQAGALAHLFGGEKWIKDFVQRLFGNAGAVIVNLDGKWY